MSDKCETMKFFNCPVGMIKHWIQFQLHSGMTFKNYGDVWKINILDTPSIVRPQWFYIYPIMNNKTIYKGDRFALLLQDIKYKIFESLYSQDEEVYENNIEDIESSDDDNSIVWHLG